MSREAARRKDPRKVLSRYEPYFQNNISLLFQAKKGLKPNALFDFISVSELAHPVIEEVFDKSMKTFQNYLEKDTVLDAGTSEKLLKLFALYSKGTEVFGSVDAFAEWLSRPAYGLGSAVPQTLLDTMTGIELVNEELVRLEYGDLA